MKNKPSNIKHLVICGSYRAGTTITARMLSMHSELLITNELCYYHSNAANHIFNKKIKKVYDNYPNIGKKSCITKNILEENYKSFLDNIMKKYPNIKREKFLKSLLEYSNKKAKYYGDKLPEYVKELKRLNQEFTKIKVIMCIRDPRDVICSQIRRYEKLNGKVGVHWWARPTVDECIKMKGSWLSYLEAWNSIKEQVDSYELQYNKVVKDKKKEAERVSSFLGINSKETKAIFTKYFKPVRHQEWIKRFPNINDKLPSKWRSIMKEYGMDI
jgi:hypothetical protein